jgi:hypothetical protein
VIRSFDGPRAFEIRDFPTESLLFPRVVTSGNAWGVGKKLTEAANCDQLFADQGNAEGQYSFGLYPERGKSIPPNWTSAEKYSRLLADQGNIDFRKKLASPRSLQCRNHSHGVNALKLVDAVREKTVMPLWGSEAQLSKTESDGHSLTE